ncbi:MAG: hypothetical protein AAF757_15460 [Cyanobacteria bacterium P01_D01_bin.116]
MKCLLELLTKSRYTKIKVNAPDSITPRTNAIHNQHLQLLYLSSLKELLLLQEAKQTVNFLSGTII